MLTSKAQNYIDVYHLNRVQFVTISEPSQHWRYEQDTYKDLIKLLQPQLQTSTSKTTPSFCMNLVNSPALLALFTSFAAWNVRQLLLQRAQSYRFREAADYRQRRRTYCQSRHRGVVKENRRLIVEQRVLTPDSILP